MKLAFFSVLITIVILSMSDGEAITQESSPFRAAPVDGYMTPPTLAVTTDGLTVSLQWNSVGGATGYNLYYAPYPYTGPDSIRNIPMGTQTSVSFDLWDGAEFYVAIRAYNEIEESGYSNIEHFILDSHFLIHPVPDTGQQKCYNDFEETSCAKPGEAFFGQDANYTINSPSYTKLDADGKDLPDSATSWSMIRDNVTGLVWENKSEDGSIHDKRNRYTWQEAQDIFIASLNESAFAGKKDWRLPTIKELVYIADYGAISCEDSEIDRYFPNTIRNSGHYWSSTSDAERPDMADTFNLCEGADNGTDKRNRFYVYAVRGRRFENAFVENGDGTVTDLSTGLMWQKATAESLMPWKEALQYCMELSLAGYTDWRLPNVKELRSLADYRKYDPAIDTAFFPDTLPEMYWTSTTKAHLVENAWGFYLSNGYDGSIDPKVPTPWRNGCYVRAVRTVEKMETKNPRPLP